MTLSSKSPQSDHSAAGTRVRVGHTVAAHRSLLGVAAALVGAVVGAAAVLFNLAIRGWTWVSTGFDEYTTHIGQSHGVWGWAPWLFLLLSPAIAGFIYGPLIQRYAPSAKGHGIPEVMLAVRRKGGLIPGRVAVVKILASALTIGSGGSAGREGPIVQVGASLGSTIASWMRMPVSRVVLLASCGSAAGIAATFHAPLAGAVFALEVILVEFTAETFGFVVLAAVTSSIVARLLQGDEMVVRVADNLAFASMSDMWWVALLGLVAGLCGLGFSKILYASEDASDWVWAHTRLPEWARPGVLGLLLGAGLVHVRVGLSAGGGGDRGQLLDRVPVGAHGGACAVHVLHYRHRRIGRRVRPDAVYRRDGGRCFRGCAVACDKFASRRLRCGGYGRGLRGCGPRADDGGAHHRGDDGAVLVDSPHDVGGCHCHGSLAFPHPRDDLHGEAAPPRRRS